MVRSRLQSAAVALILGCALIASQRSFAVCFVDAATRASSDPNAPTWPPSYTAAPSYGARLNNEGLTERVADIVVMDDGTLPNCFSLGNVITFLYNAVLRLPASVTSPSTNVDRVDSAGTAGLRVSAASTTDGQLHTTTVVITVTQAGTRRNALTGAGSALRLKNLRFGAIALAAGSSLQARLSASASGSLPTTTLIVGTVYKSLTSSGITLGAGFQNKPGPGVAASFDITEGFTGALRVAGSNVSGVYQDIATTATSLVFDVQSIPTGVTITWPATISTSYTLGASGIVLTSRTGGAQTCAGPGACQMVYDTTAHGTAAAAFSLDTARYASGVPAAGNPTIGVSVAGGASTGTATLRVVMGPTASAAFPGDDEQASAVPRYLSNVSATGVTRLIASGDWFTIYPPPTVSPAALTFGSAFVGGGSTYSLLFQTTGPVTISSISFSTNEFGLSTASTCPLKAPITGSCSLSVWFSPLATGPRAGTLYLYSNGTDNPMTVSLSGTGVALPTLTPTSLTFASQLEGTTSASQTVTYQTPLAIWINSVQVSGDFVEAANTCYGRIVSTCTISVSFQPSGAGTRTGTLTVNDQGPGSPRTVRLSGTGIAAPTVSPSSLTFSSQLVGTTSATQAVTLRSSIAVTISSIVTKGDFSQTNNCPASLPAQGSCTINVSFRPTAVGARGGTLSVSDSGPGGTRTVSLSGTGVSPPTVSPTTLTFGSQLVGTTSSAQAVTLQSAAAISISSITASGDFSQTNSCPASLPAQGSCTINVSFRPAAAGTRTGVLTVSDSGVGSPRTVTLSGTGVADNPVPVITALVPAARVVGSPAFTLSVMGASFQPGSVVQWNGQPRSTTYINSRELRALVLASDVAAAGTAQVQVSNPAPGGGLSNALGFAIAAMPPDEPHTTAAIVRTPISLVLDTRTATTSASDPTPPCGNGSRERSVWFVFTALTDGTITADTNGSDYLTIVSVYTGAPGSYVPVGCGAGALMSARAGDAAPPPPTKVSVPVTKGTFYMFMVSATNGDGGKLTFNLTMKAATPLPATPYLCTIPHVVSGSGFVTKMTVVNFARASNDVVVNVLAPDGTLQQTYTLTMDAAEVARIETAEADRSGPNTVQWAAVGSSGPVEVNLFFELTDQTAANTVINTVGFNDADTLTDFVFPVEFEPGPAGNIGRTVGIAIANPSPLPALVTLTLLDEQGNVRATDTVGLAGMAQISIDLSTSPVFSAALPPANFIGTLTGSSTTAVSVVALGDDFGPFFATPAMQKPATRIYIPHMVSGTGYVTKLTLVNPSASASDVTLSEYGQTGQVLKQTQFTLAAHGAKRMATPEEDRFRSTPTTTWAIVDATQPIAANLFFEVIFDPASRAVVNTVGFNDAPLMAEFSFPAEFEPAQPGASVGRTVGLAVANPWASSTSVTIHLINPEGIVVATEARSLPAFGQFTLDLSSDPVFTAVLPAGSFVGTVTVVASNPVAAIALEDDRGPFSALPMMSGRTF